MTIHLQDVRKDWRISLRAIEVWRFGKARGYQFVLQTAKQEKSMINRRTLIAHAGTAATLSAFGTVSWAQSAKPLNIIVGFPAGVVTDNIARIVAEELRQSYPAGVIVEN